MSDFTECCKLKTLLLWARWWMRTLFCLFGGNWNEQGKLGFEGLE